MSVSKVIRADQVQVGDTIEWAGRGVFIIDVLDERPNRRSRPGRIFQVRTPEQKVHKLHYYDDESVEVFGR